jgi:hypothetical protein
METIIDFFEIIKGDHGTIIQSIISGIILNIRLWVYGLLFVYFFKKVKERKILNYIIFYLLIYLMIFELTLIYQRREFESKQYEVTYIEKETKNLVIVIQGANFPLTDYIVKNKTEVDISNSRDLDGIGIIGLSNKNSETKIITYIGTHSYNLTPEEVFKNVYYYKQMNPEGRVILVGHSIGGYNVTQVLDKLYDKNIPVDFVVFLDNANKKHNDFHYVVKENVKYVLNLTSPKWSDNLKFVTNSGGKVTKTKENTITIIKNEEIPNTEHTTIDNTVHKLIDQVVVEYIKTNENPLIIYDKIKNIP